MSIAELKQTADNLTAKERRWMRAYLAAKEQASNPTWRAETGRRLQGMRAAREISSDEYSRRTRSLDRVRPRKPKAA